MTKYISPKLVRELFDYNPDTGVLINRRNRLESGGVDSSGTRERPKLYRRVSVRAKVRLYAHRVIWVWMTGQQPDTVDHIDGNGLNNKWDNLKSVPFRVNGKRQKVHVTNTSGVPGVYYRKDSERWRARIMVDGKSINLGTFQDKDSAIVARKSAEKEHGFDIIGGQYEMA